MNTNNNFAPVFAPNDGFATVAELVAAGLTEAQAIAAITQQTPPPGATFDPLAAKTGTVPGLTVPAGVSIRVPGVGLVVSTDDDGQLCSGVFTGEMRLSTARENPDTGKMESTLQLQVQFTKASMPKKLTGVTKRFVNATEGKVVELPSGEYTTNVPVGGKLDLQYRAGDVNGTNRAWFSML